MGTYSELNESYACVSFQSVSWKQTILGLTTSNQDSSEIVPGLLTVARFESKELIFQETMFSCSAIIKVIHMTKETTYHTV